MYTSRTNKQTTPVLCNRHNSDVTDMCMSLNPAISKSNNKLNTAYTLNYHFIVERMSFQFSLVLSFHLMGGQPGRPQQPGRRETVPNESPVLLAAVRPAAPSTHEGAADGSGLGAADRLAGWRRVVASSCRRLFISTVMAPPRDPSQQHTQHHSLTPARQSPSWGTYWRRLPHAQ